MTDRAFKRLRLLVAGLVIGGILAACAPAAPPTSAPASQPTTAPSKPTEAAPKPAAAATAAPTTAAAPTATTASVAKPAGEAPRMGGMLTVADRPDITNADPQVSNELPIIYAYAEGLTSLGDTGELKPFLASKWDASPDAKTYTFTVRDGVRFQNGRALTAEDVKVEHVVAGVWLRQRLACTECLAAYPQLGNAGRSD